MEEVDSSLPTLSDLQAIQDTKVIDVRGSVSNHAGITNTEPRVVEALAEVLA